MAVQSEISWTDATYNPWIGCTKVGPGCDNCYAERDFDLRKGRVKWGSGNPRSRTKTERQPHTWNSAHAEFFAEHGRKRRVFSASLADIFDNEAPAHWRYDFWNTVSETPLLDWYIVTKRVSNVDKMLPSWWHEASFRNVVLIVTVVNQDEADRDVPRLIALKDKYPWLRVGLSIEPMLGPISLSGVDRLNWVIAGGESGPNARPAHPDWFRSLRDQCRAASVPFHFKQWGENVPAFLIEDDRPEPWYRSADGRLDHWYFDDLSKPRAELPKVRFERVGKAKAGRLLDGIEHNGFPAGSP